MNTSTPNPDPDKYIPGVCMNCSAQAPVLVIPGHGEHDLGMDGHGCCKRCVDELYDLMNQADSYEPHIYAPYREW